MTANEGPVLETVRTTTTETWWERERRPWFLAWLLPLVALPLLFWWGQVGVRHHVQDDIRTRAEAALARAGHDDVTVRVRGRDVTLGGSLGAGVDVDDVHHVVRSLTGVRHVDEDFAVTGAAAPATTVVAASAATTLPPTTLPPTTLPATTRPPTTLPPTTTVAPAPTTTVAAPAAPATTVAPAPTTTVAPQKLAIAGLTFVSGLAEPTDGGFAAIDQAAAVLRANPTVRVRIEGHTDAQGSDAINQPLSQARADRVRNELIARGIAAERLTAQGFGSTRPIADDATPEGRAQNRRIDFVIV